jgi:hypothetical protein
MFSHTLLVTLLPSLASSQSYSFFPATPARSTIDISTSSAYSSPAPSIPSPRLRSRSGSDPPRTLAQILVSLLSPRSILASISQVHLKIHTRLTFNELGRITHHDDIWGIKEMIEGLVPVLGQLYPLQRAGFGVAISLVSRLLRPGTRLEDPDEDEGVPVEATPTRHQSLRMSALGLEMSTRPEGLTSASQAVVQRGCPVDTDRDI